MGRDGRWRIQDGEGYRIKRIKGRGAKPWKQFF